MTTTRPTTMPAGSATKALGSVVRASLSRLMQPELERLGSAFDRGNVMPMGGPGP